jgi:hypothetical protein
MESIEYPGAGASGERLFGRSIASFMERFCANRLKSHFRRRSLPGGTGVLEQTIKNLESV